MLYELLKEKRALEKLQEIFSPFRLPVELTLRTVGCDGVSNAWYHLPEVSVCYEYLNEIWITGAALSYKQYVMGPQVTAPLVAFSDAHSVPAQRF